MARFTLRKEINDAKKAHFKSIDLKVNLLGYSTVKKVNKHSMDLS